RGLETSVRRRRDHAAALDENGRRRAALHSRRLRESQRQQNPSRQNARHRPQNPLSKTGQVRDDHAGRKNRRRITTGFGFWFLVFGFWFLVLVFGFWFLDYGFWFVVFSL